MSPGKDGDNPLMAIGHHLTTTLHSEPYPAIDPTKTNFSGRSVFITGASKGIGRAISVAFARGGVSSMTLGARSDLKSLEKTVKDAAASANRPAPELLLLNLDVTKKESVESAVLAVEGRFGKLDILVNNAGVAEQANLIADSDPVDWWNTWMVNVYGVYLVTRAFLPLILKAGDKQIINASCVGAHTAMAQFSAYQPGKLALLRFTEIINSEYEKQGVLAYCVHAGNVESEIFGEAPIPDHLKEVFIDKPELGGHSIVFLTQEKRMWLAGRYVSCTWDLPEFLTMEDEIMSGDKLKVCMKV